MAVWRYENIRGMLAISDPALRGALVPVLAARGLHPVVESCDPAVLRAGLEEGDIDLLIAAADLPDGDIGALVREMRQGRIGANPFVLVVLLLDHPDQERMRRLIDCGTDDVLRLPMRPPQLVGHLDNLVAGRKSFVITHDYVGPDRRSGEESGDLPVLRLEVPNPLRWQVMRETGRAALRAVVREAAARLKQQRIHCSCRQIIYQAAALGQPGARRGEIARRLAAAAAGLGRQLEDTPYRDALDLVRRLQALCGHLPDRTTPPDDPQSDRRDDQPGELDLLMPLAQAVAAACDGGTVPAAAASG